VRVVVALGGNALLRRGEPMTAENQRRNVETAARALAPIAHEHDLIITHGSGPQVGLLALQSAAYKPDGAYPLDILDAEVEGMVGYVIEQELGNLLPAECHCATLLTQIEVDPTDPAFKQPSKPIGPLYEEVEAKRLARERGWRIARDGAHFRRVVASPRPKRILELNTIELLVQAGVVVICAGGGGIPVVRREDGGFVGIEAVIDKDWASALLARDLKAEAFIMLTDVEAVWKDWQAPGGRPIRRISPAAIGELDFDPGSMAPKVAAACAFLEAGGGIVGIGRLEDAAAILAGEAGTVIVPDAAETAWWD
jgi:carbamate kinase